MPTLCVIDMQDDFLDTRGTSARQRIVGEVISCIRAAKHNRWPIVLVEYSGRMPTVPEICQEVENYNRLSVIKKTGCDGSREIEKESDFYEDTFYLCGVYFRVCVHETAQGLAKRKPTSKVVVLRRACNEDPGFSYDIQCQNLFVNSGQSGLSLQNRAVTADTPSRILITR